MIFNSRVQPVKPPLEGFHSRVIAYLCVAVTFGAIALEQGFNLVNVTVVIYALLYPHLVRLLIAHIRNLQPFHSRLALLGIDGFNTGIFITLCAFSVVPSLVFVLLISFSSIIIGGPVFMLT